MKDRLFWAGCALMLLGLGTLMLLLAVALTPDIQGRPARQHRTPATGPTTHPKIVKPVDRVGLIIQQNPHCWNGNPGQTCGTERTYG